MRTQRSVAGAAVTAVLLAAVGACAAPVDEGVGEQDPAAAVAQEARAAGADAAQVAALDDGEVTYEEYEAAMTRAFACMREQGFQVDVRGTRPYNGVPVLDFQVRGTTAGTSLDTDAGRALLEDCTTRHSTHVEGFWQTLSPDAVAFTERRDAALRPLLRTCLEDNDVDVPDDASMQDMVASATDLLVRTDGVDCMTEIGYPTWTG